MKYKNITKTTDQFIIDSKTKHGKKYKYSKTKYKNNYTEVCIICPEHGEFYQKPTIHLMGCGCPKCALDIISKKQTMTLDEFICSAKKKHGDRYDYSKVDYKNNNLKVCICCSKHGNFYQKPTIHLMGSGCQLCWKEKFIMQQRDTKKDFVNNAKIIHGDKYNYDKVEYITSKEKVYITCLKHGEFYQQPSAHLNGQGCPKCNGVILKNGVHCLSYAEAYYYLKLLDRKITFLYNKVYDLSWGRFRYDFYIPSENKYIEITSFNSKNCPTQEKWIKYMSNIKAKKKYVEEKLHSNFEFIQIEINTEVKRHVLKNCK